MKTFIWIIAIALVTANIIVFRSSVEIGQKIAQYEADIRTLRHENLIWEQNVYSASSLELTASSAASLDYVAMKNPYYIGEHVYALR